MKHAKMLLILICGLGVANCAGGGPTPIPTPTPVLDTVTWEWQPGTCNDRFRLYRLNGQNKRTLVIDTQATGYRAQMKMETSTWVVSGVCAEGEFFSDPVIFTKGK